MDVEVQDAAPAPLSVGPQVSAMADTATPESQPAASAPPGPARADNTPLQSDPMQVDSEAVDAKRTEPHE
eukprot:8903513-Pyramimonas_sp.AAC.1